MKYILIVIMFIPALTSSGQIVDFSNNYFSQDAAGCDPFIDPTQFQFKWNESHGSPSLTGNNNTAVYAKLEASFLYHNQRIGEGVFLQLDGELLSNHTYDIKLAVQKGSGITGFGVKLHDGLTASKTATCQNEELPEGGEAIYWDDYQPGNSTTFSTLLAADNYKPTKNYDQIWLYTDCSILGQSGTVIVKEIEIIDNGPNDPGGSDGNSDPIWNPAQVKSCSYPNWYPSICSNYTQYCNSNTITIGGPRPDDNAHCFSYKWQYSTDKVTWSEVPDSPDAPYYTVPQPVSQIVYYRRLDRYSYGSIITCSGKSYTQTSNVVWVKAFDENVVMQGEYSAPIPFKAYKLVSNQGDVLIHNTADVRTRSEEEIFLGPGFEVEPGGRFVAEIGALCQQGNWKMAYTNPDEDSNDSYSPKGITIDNSTSVDEYFEVFPNPISEGRLNFWKEAGFYYLFDSKGALVKSGQNSGGFEIDGLEKGIYLLKVDNFSKVILIQ